MNWVVIAAQGTVTVFLLLAVLGAMREITLLRSDVRIFRDLIQRPPAPSFVGGRMPDVLARELERVAWSDGATERQAVAFLSPACSPCEVLADDLTALVGEDESRRDKITLVVSASDDVEAERFAAKLPLRAIVDRGGTLLRACEIRGTPSVFMVSRSEHNVLDYSPEANSEWVLEQITTHQAAKATA